MNEANWPIRIGGIYRLTKGDVECRVTAIDGDKVYSILRTEHCDGKIHEHNPQRDSIGLFRRIYMPEDQSPIPALIAALKLYVDQDGTDRSGPSAAGRASVLAALRYRLAQDALAKAEACGYTPAPNEIEVGAS